MQLYTQHNFSVVRQIADHTDATVYYVRAVIRNAYTDEIIATLDLDSKGNQRYKKDWRIPADPSGEGFYISIVTSVYTDSGHTTKSPNYGDEENTFLVIDRPRVVGGNAGNGGGLARRDVRDIIVEELQKIIPQLTPKETEQIRLPEQKEYDSRFDEIFNAIKEVGKMIKPSEKVDLSPLLKQLTVLKTAIDAIKMPEIDLSPVLSAIKDHLDTNEVSAEELKAILEEMTKNLDGKIEKVFLKVLKEINLVTSSVTFLGGKEIPGMHKNNLGIEDKKNSKDKVDISKTKLY